MVSETVIRYSEAFKVHVVWELEKGTYDSPSSAAQAFGVGCSTTVQRWVKKYGKNHLLKKVIRVEKADERDVVKELKKQVRELESALARSTVEQVMLRSQLEVFSEHFGVQDIAALKKKRGS